MKSFFKNYWLVMICAVLVGIILTFGQYASIYELGDDYRGIPYLYQDNDDVYMSRIHEVVDGHYSVSSPYFFEYKDASVPLLPYGEFFYALPVKLFGLDPVSFIHFAKFLFPAILFFIIFWFIHLLLRKKSMVTAIAGAVAILLVSNVFNLGYLKNLFDSQGFVLSIWTRLVNPITGGIMLFAFLALLIKVRQRSFYWTIGAGLLFGFMAGYYFAFALAGLTALLLIIFLIFEKEYKTAGRLALVYPIAFLVNFKYFGRQIEGIIGGGDGLAISLRNGLFVTNQPLLNNTLFLGIAVFFIAITFLFLKHRNEFSAEKSSIQLVSSTLLAGIIAFNHQIITGKAIWPYHFVQYTKPIVVIALLYAGYLLFSRFRKLWQAVMVVVIIFSFGIGIKESLSYRSNLDNYREYQRYGQVIDWLNDHSSDGCVVAVKEAAKLYREGGNNVVEHLNLLISAVTPCDMHFSSYTFFNVPPDRIYHGYLTYLRLNGVTDKSINQFLEKNRVQVITVFHENWAEMFYPGRNEPWLLGVSDFPKMEAKIDSLIEKISNDYPSFMRQDFGEFLKQYRVDYLVYDKKYGGDWNREWNIFLEKEFESDDFVIYGF